MLQGSGDRVFYESLYKEKGPTCSMALVWCIERGVLPRDQAKALQKQYLMAKELLKGRTATSNGAVKK